MSSELRRKPGALMQIHFECSRIKYSLLNNKGVSLVELLMAITIVAIVITPLLGTILNATRNNISTNQTIEANDLAQKCIEEVQAKPDLLETNSGNGYLTFNTIGDFVVKYKVIKEVAEKTDITENQQYTHTAPYELPANYHLQMTVPVSQNTVSFNNVNYLIGNDNVYTLQIAGANGAYSYTWKNATNTLDTGGILGVTANTVDIFLDCNEMSETFRLNIVRDGLESSKIVRLFSVDDSNSKAIISNTGTNKTLKFYYYNVADDNKENSNSQVETEYENMLYKIEVSVERSGVEQSHLVSYVKK